MKKSKLYAVILLLFVAATASAIPARHGQKRVLTLTDGTTVTAELVGDEHGHFWRGDDGKAYQEVNAGDVYQEVDAQHVMERAQARRSAANARRAQRLQGPKKAGAFGDYTGQKKGIIILVNFKDTQFKSTSTLELYQRIANEENFSYGDFRGSMYDYFYASSDGQFQLTFDVLGPVTMPNNMSYYGQDSGGEGNDAHPGEMVVEALNQVDSQVDFKDYDWDNDGEVDQVYIIYAGKGQADGGAANTIWPHEWSLSSEGSGRQRKDNVYINTYACGSELNGSGKIAGIGTMCHEFTHCLGFPDFYDVNYNGCWGMNEYDLMDYGSYNVNGYQPCAYTSYERWMAGWKTPIELTNTKTYSSVKALTDGGDSYIIYNKGNHNEYYLLENRQPIGWDASLSGKGLLILHVDYSSSAWNNNTVNTQSNHQRMTYFAADNNYTSGSTRNDPYPYVTNSKTVDALNKSTTPAASFYNRNSDNTYYLDTSIENIKQNSDGTISFRYKGLSNVDTPVITPEQGRYDQPQTVTITCGTEDAIIYYTLDGTEPTTNSTRYTQPFTVSTTTVITAVAVVDDDFSDLATTKITMVSPDDVDKWYVDFEDSKVPANMAIIDGNWSVVVDPTDASNHVLYQSSYGWYNIISPLLEVKELEDITFEAMRYSNYSEIYVDYSFDRSDWHEVLHVTNNQLVNSLTEFTVSGIPAGQVYLRFSNRYTYMDNIYGGKLVPVTHDIQIVESNIPTVAEVNKAVSMSVKLDNYFENDEPADSYKVRLYEDGVVVAEAPTVKMQSGHQYTFNLSYTPHTAGMHTVYIAFEADDYVKKTADVQITVAPESLTEDVQVGNPTNNNYNYPVDVYDDNSESETVYPASLLGLDAGTLIKKITWKGWYNPSNDERGDVAQHKVEVWIENTTDNVAGSTMKDVANMTKVYEGMHTYEKIGTQSSPADVLSLELNEPFLYDGSNLRIHVRSMSQDDNYLSFRFQTSYVSGTKCLYRYSYSTTDFSQMTLNTANNYIPVVYLGTEKQTATVSGNVTLKADNTPVADQKVTLTSGDVLYEATTDANGHYEMTVVQTALTYQMRIDKDGYNPFIKDVSFGELNQVIDAQLEVSKGLVVESMNVVGEVVANNDVTINVQVTNYSANAVDTNYTARLYNAAGDVLAELTPVAIAANESHNFTFTFRLLGTNPVEVYAAFESANFTAGSDHLTLTPKAEITGDEVTLGTGDNYSYSIPFDAYYTTDDDCQFIYAANEIGLKNGDKIQRITLKGYNFADGGYTYNSFDGDVTVWLENTNSTSGSINSTNQMTKVFDGRVTFEAGSSFDPVVMLDMPLNESFVYTGQSLRVWMQLKNKSVQSKNCYFEVQSKTSYFKTNNANYWSNKSYRPVLNITTFNGKQLEGQISDAAGVGVPGAAMTLSKDGVLYETKTDAEGFYSMTVAQTEGIYTLTITSNGFVAKAVENVTFGSEATKTLNVTLDYAVPEYVEGRLYPICLPVALDAAAVSEAGQFYALKGMGENAILFTEVHSTEAYVPYVFIAADASHLFDGMDNWTIDNQANTTATADNVSFIGTVSRQRVVASGNATYYLYRASDSMFGSFNSAYISPFRGYFIVEGGNAGKAFAISLEDQPIATGIEDNSRSSLLSSRSSKDGVYDLQGRRLADSLNTLPKSQLKSGVYIVNGKRVVINK